MKQEMIDLFTVAEVNQARGLSHAQILEIVRPIMARINQQTEQVNDERYMAYRLEYLSGRY